MAAAVTNNTEKESETRKGTPHCVLKWVDLLALTGIHCFRRQGSRKNIRIQIFFFFSEEQGIASIYLFIIYLFISLAALCLRCCTRALPSRGERWSLLLRSTGSRRTGPAAPRHAGSPRTGDQTRVPCTGRRIPNHCATREAPRIQIFKNSNIRKYSKKGGSRI